MRRKSDLDPSFSLGFESALAARGSSYRSHKNRGLNLLSPRREQKFEYDIIRTGVFMCVGSVESVRRRRWPKEADLTSIVSAYYALDALT